MSNKDVTRGSLQEYLCDDVIEIVIDYLTGRTFWESVKLGYIEIVIRTLDESPSYVCPFIAMAKNSNERTLNDIAAKYKTKNSCKVCLSYYTRG